MGQPQHPFCAMMPLGGPAWPPNPPHSAGSQHRPRTPIPRQGITQRTQPAASFHPLTGGRAFKAALLIRLRKPIATDLHHLLITL